MTRLLASMIAGLLSLAVSAAGIGAAKAPSQSELFALLNGNTLTGEWDGRPFTQHFATNRTTRYREGDGETTHGTWRVIDNGQYCSIWPPFPRETCYDVLVDGNTILWQWGGKIHPSTVTPGDSFD